MLHIIITFQERFFKEETYMKPSQRLMVFIAASFLILAGTLATGIAFRGSVPGAHAAGFLGSYFAPYADVTLSSPTLQAVTQSTGQKYYTLAFIGSNGCN